MAQLTMQQVIDASRLSLNDDAKVRYSDAEALVYANDALDAVALARPDLFSVIADIPSTAGSAVQRAPADCLRVMEIFQVKGGRVVRESSRETMDHFDPNWMAARASRETRNWFRHERDPARFFVYPPPVSGVVYVAQYAQVPGNLALGDPFPLPNAYSFVVQSYIVFRAESKDTEYATSARAVLFEQMFEKALGVSVQAKGTTDGA